MHGSVILAEIGRDMNQLPTEDHLASWSAICPGNNESGGKRRTGKTRRTKRSLAKKLEALGYNVSLEEKTAA